MRNVELLAITPGAEELIERAGRTCYMSLDRATPGSAAKFIGMLVRMGHESVLEHAYATFRIRGCSRSFTHQIVRHRLCSFSQRSQRYVSDAGFEFVTPPSILANGEALRYYEVHMRDTDRLYRDLASVCGIPREDARFVLPNAATSEIVISCNFRELRHVFGERCAPAAQWEIRGVCMDMLRIMQEEAPSAFADFVIDEDKGTASCVVV